jgi:twitching motility protein PilT
MADIKQLIAACLERNPSDILLVPGEPALVRLDGVMARLAFGQVLDAEECKTLIYSMLTPALRNRFEETGELDLSYSIDGRVNLRVNIYNQRNGVAAAMRPIPRSIPTCAELGLPDNIMPLTTCPRGLVLITGPTGMGKSTTMAAMIQHINKTQRKHIVTIEDPIEFIYENDKSIVDQREVGRHTGSFAQALKYALRQNPDIIMIGEMRDLETMELAIRAAETGHLCFSTLHTKDAPSTIGRIISEFPIDQREKACIQLSACLAGVICQNLLPRKDRGLACAREVMMMNPAISTVIRDNRLHQIYGAIESGLGEGMCSMDQSLAALVKNGVIDFQEALKHARDMNNFRAFVATAVAAAPAGPPVGFPGAGPGAAVNRR